jgi:hypothetical protein
LAWASLSVPAGVVWAATRPTRATRTTSFSMLARLNSCWLCAKLLQDVGSRGQRLGKSEQLPAKGLEPKDLPRPDGAADTARGRGPGRAAAPNTTHMYPKKGHPGSTQKSPIAQIRGLFASPPRQQKTARWKWSSGNPDGN